MISFVGKRNSHDNFVFFFCHIQFYSLILSLFVSTATPYIYPKPILSFSSLLCTWVFIVLWLKRKISHGCFCFVCLNHLSLSLTPLCLLFITYMSMIAWVFGWVKQSYTRLPCWVSIPFGSWWYSSFDFLFFHPLILVSDFYGSLRLIWFSFWVY